MGSCQDTKEEQVVRRRKQLKLMLFPIIGQMTFQALNVFQQLGKIDESKGKKRN